MDFLDQREQFAIRSSIIQMELEEISDRLRKIEIEMQLFPTQEKEQKQLDVYKSPQETTNMQPPKKKMRPSP